MCPSRRQLLSALPAGLCLAPLARAASDAPEQKFLFVYCPGGWDPTYVFAPAFDKLYVDTEGDAQVLGVGNLSFVDSSSRPAVRKFFAYYAERSCIWNGVLVPSVSHDRAERLLFTGGTSAAMPDWGSILAAEAQATYALPYVVVAGPVFGDGASGVVVRWGEEAQLPSLFDGTALTDLADTPTPLPGAEDEASVSAFLAARADRYAASAGPGRASDFASRFSTVLGAVGAVDPGLLEEVVGDTGLREWPRFGVAVRCLAAGLSRCALVPYEGVSWDSHGAIETQSEQFEGLFQHLSALMYALDTTAGPNGGPLSDEVTVVVFSEMGRGPAVNAQSGKDHMTTTSMLTIGPLTAGGMVVGGIDDYGAGVPTDLLTGLPSETGVYLTCAHFGATILAAGGVETPADVDGEPVLGALR